MVSKQDRLSHEFDMILKALGEFPGGASAEEIRTRSGLALELRTIQRRLEKLVVEGKVKLSGMKRGAKYHLASASTYHTTTKDISTEKGNAIPLTNESKEILSRLSTPFEQRTRVGYNREFLEEYRPNESYYLSKSERQYLADLSFTTADRDQPAGTYARHILQRLLIDLSWNSSRLEGNTYSLLDTERLIEQGEPAKDKSAEETQMILNHKEAIEFIVSSGNDIGFNRYTLQNLHAILANNLLPDPAAPGRIRQFAVGIKKSAYIPTAIPQLIVEMFDRILEKASAIKNPHEQALFVMIHLPYLQPFEDVNKRVSRLAANIPLIRHNLIPISFIGVSHELYINGLLGIYEFNRIDLLKDIFIWACSQSADRYATVRQTVGEPNPFRIKYRNILQLVVGEIVREAMNPGKASIVIQSRAVRLAQSDSKAFIEMVETELLSLHEGNFARYGVTPNEFRNWKDGWKR